MMKVLKKPAVATVAAQLVGAFAQLFVDIVAARALGPELAGEVVFAMATAGMLSVVMLMGTGEVAMSMYARAERRGQHVMSASFVVLCAGALAAALLATGVTLVTDVDARGASAVALAMCALFANGASSVFNQVIIARGVAARDLSAAIQSRALLLVLALGGAAMESPHAVLAAYVVAATAHMLLRARIVHKHIFAIEWDLDREVLRELWSRGRHIGLGSIFGTVSNKADTLWLRASAGLEQVGIYGAAYRVIGGMQLVATSCSLALYPGLTRGERRAKLGYMIAAPLGAVLLLLASAIIPEPLVLFVYGQAYAEAAPVLTILLLAGIAQWIHAWAARWVIATHKERALPHAQAVGCATLLIGLATLTPTMGAVGAAWATFAADWLGLFTLAVSVRRLK